MPQYQTQPKQPDRSMRDVLFDRAYRLIEVTRATRSGREGPLDSDGFTEEERVGGELLDALAMELRPALRDAARALSVGDEPNRFVLTGDGRFLRLEAGSAWPIRRTAALMRVEPDIRAVLNDLEVGLVEANRPMCSAGAELLRAVRAVVERGLAEIATR